MTNVTDGQMELGFNGFKPQMRAARGHARPGRGCSGAARREGRIARAGWWFARMRDIVEQAMDIPGQPRPEQIWIPGATREVKV